MHGDATDILSRYPVARYRLTVADYHRLGAAGILGAADRVELLEGQLVEMAPIGPRHALAADALVRLLVRAVPDWVWVRAGNPITLDGGSEPQPDVALVRNPWRGYPQAHPTPEDAMLLVEVADSSRDIDIGAKRELYAHAGIAEFWIVDLTRDVVVVCREPDGERYRSVSEIAPPGLLEVAALPGVVIAVAALVV